MKKFVLLVVSFITIGLGPTTDSSNYGGILSIHITDTKPDNKTPTSAIDLFTFEI